MRRKRLLYLILPVITLILELLPYGAVCNFANPEGEPWRETYSYFDLTPFGYANFTPFLTAVVTCLVLALLLLYWAKGSQKVGLLARNILAFGAVVSMGPLAFGLRFFSPVGALITVTLVVELFLLHRKLRNS